MFKRLWNIISLDSKNTSINTISSTSYFFGNLYELYKFKNKFFLRIA